MQAKEAVSLYESLEKKKFTYMHCYELLKGCQKWTDYVENKKQKTTSSGSPGSSRRPDVEVQVDHSQANNEDAPNARPIGIKAAKETRRRSTSSSSTWNESAMKATVDSFNSRLRESDEARNAILREHHMTHQQGLDEQRQTVVAIEREKLELFREVEEKKLKLKEREVELKDQRKRRELEAMEQRARREQEAQEANNILQLDLSKLDDDAKEYYRLMRQKLIAKAREDD